MAESDFIRDPVTGLEEFVLDIKPYHTKIIDVLVEYIYQDNMSVSILDSITSTQHIELNRVDSGCPDGFGSGFDFLAGAFEPGAEIQSILGQVFTLSSLAGDITAQFPTGKAVKVINSSAPDETFFVDFSTFNGTETEVTVLTAINILLVDGELTSYVYDPSDIGLIVSSYDVLISECSVFGANGTTMAATTFEELLTIIVTTEPTLGGEWDSFTVNGFDPFSEGYDI